MAETEKEPTAVEAVATKEPATESKTHRPREGDAEQAAATPHRPRKQMGRRKVCQFCVDHIEHIDYKDVAKIRRYIAENGKIISRRQTGTCAKHQREITTAIKRARYMGLIYYKGE